MDVNRTSPHAKAEGDYSQVQRAMMALLRVQIRAFRSARRVVVVYARRAVFAG